MNIKKFLVFIISSIIAFFTGVIISDNNTIQTKEYIIRTNKINKNVRFAFLTDLHGRVFGDGNQILIDKIDRIKPDFIVIGGDMITAKFTFTVEPVIDFVKILSRKYTIYYSMGNHEARLKWSPGEYKLSYEQFCNKLRDAGAIVLDNEGTLYEDSNIRFIGLNLERAYYYKKHKFTLSKHHIDKLTGVMPNDKYNILLAHNPEYMDVYSKTNANLVLAGHMHGGIMRLPFGYGAMDPRFSIIRPFCWGTQKIGRTKAIISPGIAMHTIPLRVFNPGEISVVTIKKNRKLKSVLSGIKKKFGFVKYASIKIKNLAYKIPGLNILFHK